MCMLCLITINSVLSKLFRDGSITIPSIDPKYYALYRLKADASKLMKSQRNMSESL